MKFAPVCVLSCLLLATLASAQNTAEICERKQVEPVLLCYSSSLVTPMLNLQLPANGHSAIDQRFSPLPELPAFIALQQPEHKFFWDRANVSLFAALSAARAMDMHSTWRFRARGSNEAQLSNALVDNKPLFVTFSAGMVGAQILSSYMLHRTGHHKLERISALIDIGLVTGTAAWNYIGVQPARHWSQ